MPLPTEPRSRTASTLAVAAVLALAGCVHTPPAPAPVVSAVIPPPLPPPAPPPPPQPPAPTPAELADAAARRLFAFQDRLRELPPADVARELGQRDPPADAASTVELALLLAHNRGGDRPSDRANGDLARAIALLEPLVRNGATPWQGPARLLHARLVEQRRLEEQVEKLAQQQREQARRIEQLASQLEALRAIERSLSAPRPATPAPAAPAATPAPRSTP